ncbi:MAG TPA: hypothetical protein PLF81_07610 [Candidatus Anammoximicrobium sp.]|nr:hypothetical protein [Candidatus Anammoximicrobium sp.]
MTPNPILKVLSTLSRNRVRYLLMGGQACVFYGAAEFSRDTDIVVLAAAENLDRLSAALEELQAECIAVPPFEAAFLNRGHAIRFRCHHREASGMRIDVMSVLRGVPAFDILWERRVTLQDPSDTQIQLLALSDLVKAKKTQRDKDWPMLRRLIEADIVQHRATAPQTQIRFWLEECRSPGLLMDLAKRHEQAAAELAAVRPLLRCAIRGDENALSEALTAEEQEQRAADRAYWAPLKAELEQLRHSRR